MQRAGARVASGDRSGAHEGLGDAGFDPVYGARPLKRAIQQQLENPLAERILSGDFGPGDTVRVDADGDGLSFTSVERQAA